MSDALSNRKSAKEYVNTFIREPFVNFDGDIIRDEKFLSYFDNTYDNLDFEKYDTIHKLLTEALNCVIQGSMDSILTLACMRYETKFGNYPKIDYVSVSMIDGVYYLRIVIDGLMYGILQDHSRKD